MPKNRAFDHSKYQNWIDPHEVTEYQNNAKKHDDRQVKNIANSIRRFGWQQDTVLTSDNVLVIGHGRRLAALEIGCEMPYHRIDKNADELTDKDIRELRIADNQTNAETGFDWAKLELEIGDLDFEDFDFDFGETLEKSNEEEKKYTTQTKIPQYEPQGEEVSIMDLVETGRAESLIEEIESAEGITQDERNFLKLAAKRHNMFNYKKIAEYYSNASQIMQSLMERSALVIIDVDDAIAMGYAKLAQTIEEMRDEE